MSGPAAGIPHSGPAGGLALPMGIDVIGGVADLKLYEQVGPGADPSSGGSARAIGTIQLRDDGSRGYVKYGTGDTDWCDLTKLGSLGNGAGTSFGRTITGGTGSGENLDLVSTSHATPGLVRVLVNSASTNTVVDGFALVRTVTGGSGAAGVGVGQPVYIENAAGNSINSHVWRYSLTTATGAAEIAAARLALIDGGALPATGSEQHRWTPGQYLAPDGTQSLPGISFASDPDTGLWRSGANALDLIAGGTRSLIVTNAALAVGEGINLSFGPVTGSMIGDQPTDKIALWGNTPIVQPSSTGQTAGHTAGAGAGVTVDSTFTGGTGTKAYTVGDLVRHLKAIGAIAAS